MPKLPILTAAELIKIIKKFGFEKKRQKGSHIFFVHDDGRTTVIPFHAGEAIDRGLLSKIIKQDLQISYDKFLNIFND